MGPHRALGISDILYTIFDLVEYTGDFEDTEDTIAAAARNEALARCAMTCRAFLEPALDTLWRDMDSLHPFLTLLPSFGEAEGIYFLGEVTTANWSRFENYAKRLQNFTMSDPEENKAIDSSVYVRLTQLGKGIPLFPSLCNLSYSDYVDSSLLLFLSPSLQSIDFDIDWTLDTCHLPIIGTFLHSLTGNSPMLKSLNLNLNLMDHSAIFQSPRPFLDLSRRLLAPVAKFKSLRSLSLSRNAACPDSIDALVSLENLHDLSIDAHDFPVSFDRDPKSTGFRALEVLRVTGSLSVIAMIIKMVDPVAPLHHCSLSPIASNGVPVSTSADLRREMDVLQVCFSTLSGFQHSLVSLFIWNHIRSWLSDVDAYSHDVSWLTVVSPLLQLHHLEQLFIPLPMGALSMSDEDVHEMAVSWPKIVGLHLPLARGDIQPTLTALHSFAQYCPHLKTLSLTLNACNIPSPSDIPLSCRSLLEIVVGDSPIDDPRLVACRLYRLFPSLVSIRGPAKWRAARDLMETFRENEHDHEERHLLILNATDTDSSKPCG